MNTPGALPLSKGVVTSHRGSRPKPVHQACGASRTPLRAKRVAKSASELITPSSTVLMGERIVEASTDPFDRAVEQIGLRMIRCGSNLRGWRCGHPLCPRCAVRIAKKNYAALTDKLRSLPRGTKIAHVTLTGPAHNIKSGHRALFDSFSRLRRRDAWASAIAGGYAQGEVLPTVAGDLQWHVHLHVLVQPHHRARLDQHAIRNDWQAILALHDAVGSVTWTTITRKTVEGRRGGRFLTGRVLRHETKTGARLARLHACRATSTGARLRWTSMGHALRYVGHAHVMCSSTTSTISTRDDEQGTNRTSPRADRNDRARRPAARNVDLDEALDEALDIDLDIDLDEALDEALRAWMGRRPLHTLTDRLVLRGLVLRSAQGLGRTPLTLVSDATTRRLVHLDRRVVDLGFDCLGEHCDVRVGLSPWRASHRPIVSPGRVSTGAWSLPGTPRPRSRGHFALGVSRREYAS